MEAKDNRNPDVDQIKILTASKAAPTSSDNNKSTKVYHNKKERSGVLSTHTQQGNKTPKNKGSKSYYVLCKKSGILERKYKSNSSENCFGKRSDRGLG